MGQSSAKEVQGKPVVVVLGGGYAGLAVAQALDKDAKFNVILIDRKDYFLHNIAALRASVEGVEWADHVLIPYKKALLHGTVVHAEARAITANAVYLHGREEPVHFEYLIVATGTSYAFPAKIAAPSVHIAHQKYIEAAEIIRRATSIAVIGGGPTGVELCGEIRARHPEKRITLIHSQPELIPGNGLPEFKQLVLEKLKKINITLLLNQRLSPEDEAAELARGASERFVEGQRTVHTTGGKTVNVDLVFFCTGALVNNQSFGNLPVDPSGRLLVNEFLQVRGHEKIFAIGDCAAIEAQLAYFGGLQAAQVAKNILSLSTGAPLKPYTTHPNFVMLVPIGPDDGVSQLPLGEGKVFGSTTTKMLKAKDLVWPKIWKQLHVKANKELPEEPHEVSQIRAANLASALHISPEEAVQLRLSGFPLPDHEEGAAKT